VPVGVDEQELELVRLVGRAPRDIELERECHRRQDRAGDRPATSEDVELAVDLLCGVGEHHGHAHGLTLPSAEPARPTTRSRHP
jgi:hypothetical protein